MKKSLFAIAVAGLMALGLSSTAQAHEKPCYDPGNFGSFFHLENWYATVRGNIGWHDDMEFVDFGGAGGVKVDFDHGYGVQTSIGYIMNSWRIELEYFFQKFDVDNVSVNNGGTETEEDAGGRMKTNALMLNLFYFFPVQDSIDIYFGAGLGVAYQNYCRSGTTLMSATAASSDSVGAFAWQLLAGAVWNFNENIGLAFGYRFFVPAKNIKDTNDFGTCPVHDYPYTNNIELGVIFRF